ncbi:uncharacterized protein LOC143426258 [Xylocopa sonorina]|uniref:uncharacterized protein LOC143426258 n=1 Tax=Xylocopa sonorina TaxID=1818115 RepID=UPI00403A7F21
MERLYAVASEELRVWSIWLTMIGDLADEWQRWLRAHIDLVTRLAEQLRAMEKASSQPKEKSQLEVIQSEVDSAEILSVSAVDQAEIPNDVAEDQVDIPGEAGDVHPETSVAKREISMNGQATDATVVASEKSKVPLAAEDEGENGVEDATGMWPIGAPWVHLGIEDAVDEAPFERLPLPESEEEMRQFLKKFTHEATVYRSYYKHWKETADQAIKAVGCRMVMATYRVQGKDEQGRTKKPPCPKPVIVKRSRAARRSRRKKPARKARGKSAPTTEEAVPPSSITIVDEEEAVDVPPPNPGNSANETTEESPAAEEGTAKRSTEETSEANEFAKTSNSQASVKTYESEAEVSDLVRDCARADEPLPYIFYARAEPDIDIAIEHDDEVVIVEDTDRENIVADYKRLFFNLTDKPCKGGKPWI